MSVQVWGKKGRKCLLKISRKAEEKGKEVLLFENKETNRVKRRKEKGKSCGEKLRAVGERGTFL